MNFPCQGQFWLPGSADEPVFGTLNFSRREGAMLSLADSLPGTGARREFDIILGQTASGAYVTLLHAIRTAEPLFALTATRPCSYHATFLIIGAAFESEADMRFLRIPAMPIANSNLMAITIPIDADHHRSEATLGCTYHRQRMERESIFALERGGGCGARGRRLSPLAPLNPAETFQPTRAHA